jgi:hypothetical protein
MVSGVYEHGLLTWVLFRTSLYLSFSLLLGLLFSGDLGEAFQARGWFLSHYRSLHFQVYSL